MQEVEEARACLKKAFCKMCVTVCGRFRSDEGAIAGYGNRIRVKSPAKWGVQIAGMIFQTHSKKPPVVTDEDAPELSAALYKAFKCSVIRHNRRNELNTSQYRLFKQTDWALFGGKDEERKYSCI